MYENSVRKPQGYATIAEPGKGVQERDTLQCPHCGGVIHVGAVVALQGRWCFNCKAVTCGAPACNACTPFMKRIEAQEKRFARSRW